MSPLRRHSPTIVAAALLALGLAPPSEFVATLEDAGPNRHDLERIERGYYEQLLDAGRRLSAVEPAPFDAGRLCDVVADLREYVLKPNLRTKHRGASWTTNSSAAARPRICRQQAREHREDRAGGRLDRLGLGRRRRPEL